MTTPIYFYIAIIFVIFLAVKVVRMWRCIRCQSRIIDTANAHISGLQQQLQSYRAINRLPVEFTAHDNVCGAVTVLGIYRESESHRRIYIPICRFRYDPLDEPDRQLAIRSAAEILDSFPSDK